ncbi:MAG: signal peptide peptidase SppA [Deltaproteobacteria bacterium]|nr:signal peptide peptidase SppA [Deltaproteobacteria bacterium]
MFIFKRSKVAVIRYSGTITAQNVMPYIGLLRRIEKIKHIKGIMFIMDSPGGSAIHSELLYYALKRLKEKGKRLYGYLEVAASGGYMVACALERLYAPSSAIIGSIGVISVKPVLKEILGKVGIGYEVIKKGKHKDMWLFTRQYSDEERVSVGELQEDIYNRFIDIVSEGRGVPSEDILNLATGELFSSKKSLANKLIDEIAGFDKALEDLCKTINVNPDKALYLSVKKPFLQKIIGGSVLNMVEEIYYRTMY